MFQNIPNRRLHQSPCKNQAAAKHWECSAAFPFCPRNMMDRQYRPRSCYCLAAEFTSMHTTKEFHDGWVVKGKKWKHVNNQKLTGMLLFHFSHSLHEENDGGHLTKACEIMPPNTMPPNTSKQRLSWCWESDRPLVALMCGDFRWFGGFLGFGGQRELRCGVAWAGVRRWQLTVRRESWIFREHSWLKNWKKFLCHPSSDGHRTINSRYDTAVENLQFQVFSEISRVHDWEKSLSRSTTGISQFGHQAVTASLFRPPLTSPESSAGFLASISWQNWDIRRHRGNSVKFFVASQVKIFLNHGPENFWKKLENEGFPLPCHI